MRIGLFSQKLKKGKQAVLNELLAICDNLGVKCEMGLDEIGLSFDPEKSYKHPDQFAYLKEVDAVITLGGDGTILHAVALIGEAQTPILGINLGRLGFLASVEQDKMKQAVQALIEEDYRVDERSMLQLESNISIFQQSPFALNDFTLHKRDTSSMITIHAYLNGDFLTSFWADGLIISTPTGSTGYSLSCGGPIVFPQSGNFVITPVAPHNLNVRPIVISDTNTLSFKIEGRARTFMCSLDSRYERITRKHELSLKKCTFKTKLIHPNTYSYTDNIRRKLTWGVDKRNDASK